MPSEDTVEGVIQGIRVAWYSGRRVVPIVGAGLSADSGVPVIPSLVRYFCKFHQYLHHRAYLPPPPGGGPDPFDRLAALYRSEPWRYVAQFGWPDRFDLNQDLQAILEEAGPGEAGVPPFAAAVRAGYEAIHAGMNPDGVWELGELRKGVRQRFGRAFEKAVRALPDGDGESGNLAVGVMTDELNRAIDDGFEENDRGDYVPYRLLGDWRKVIQYFTHYQGEYADVLFHRLCGGRRPSLGHRFLAFLVKLLTVRTVFTFNFDDLIERALRGEGVEHQVFAMEHGSGLPHPALIRDVTAVVKMHGSTHALLLDERLDRPLADEYKKRFLELVGPNPLLLVVGCSGGDNRLRDLLDHTVRNASGGAEVAWVHFEATPPAFLAKLREQVAQVNQTPAAPGAAARKAVLRTASTNNPGLTLQHIHSALVGRHPASPVPYTAHVNRPLRHGPPPAAGPKADPLPEVRITEEHPFVVLTSFPLGSPAPPNHYPVRTSSEALVDIAAHWTRRGWQPVWVDLEAAHTLAAVVGSIIDQCRAADTALAPSVLPITDHTATEVRVTAASVRRVVEALRRSRYVVLLDGLEAYLWPPTTHHGETAAGRQSGESRLNRLLPFLLAFAGHDRLIGESKLVLGVDRSKVRAETSAKAQALDKYEEFVSNLCVTGVWHHTAVKLPDNGGTIPFTETFAPPSEGADADRPCTPFVTPILSGERLKGLAALVPNDGSAPPDPAKAWGVALMLLTTVRRARHLVTARHLLRAVFGNGRQVDEVLREVTTGPAADALGMTRLEGGGLWCHRPVRDAIYGWNSRYAGTAILTECLTGDPSPAKVRMAAAQTFLQAVAHQRVSRMYYTYTFVQTDDATTFLEYTYHRVSSVRYLAKLLALLDREMADPRYKNCATRGIADSLAAVRAGLTERGGRRFWRGMEVEGALGAVLQSDHTPVAAADCRKAVAGQHAREISSLTRAWVRAEPILRTQLPAEQLIFWAESTLLRDDIPRRMNGVVVRRPGKQEEIFAVGPEADAALAGFTEVLADFITKLKYERADSDGAALHRWAILKAESDQATKKLRHPPSSRWAYLMVPPSEVPGRLTEPPQPADFLKLIPRRGKRDWIGLPQLHYLLDAAACFTKRSQERGKADDTVALLEKVRERLEEIVGARGGADDETRKWDWSPDQVGSGGDYHEAWMRYYYLRAEAELQDVSVFAQSIGFIGRPPIQVEDLPERQLRMKRANDAIESGLTHLRVQTPRGDGRLRSLILDPTAGGSLYLPYRAALYSLHGRLHWLRAVRDEAVTANVDRLNDDFESAFQFFDMALGGLRNTNHQVAAQNELYRVEACLARARVALHPDSADARNPAAALALATAKYESARTGLQRARTHLQTGRRNVIWWKLFYALVAQYHADRLTVGTVHLLRDWPTTADRRERYLAGVVRPGEALTRLRRGYASVRAGLDLREPAPTGEANWPWLRRVWREMTMAGYVLCRLTLRHAAWFALGFPDDYKSPDAQHRYAIHVLTCLNRSARLLVPTDLPTTHESAGNLEWEIAAVLRGEGTDPLLDWTRRRLTSVHPEERPDAPAPGNIDALTLRVDLLTQARDWLPDS